MEVRKMCLSAPSSVVLRAPLSAELAFFSEHMVLVAISAKIPIAVLLSVVIVGAAVFAFVHLGSGAGMALLVAYAIIVALIFLDRRHDKESKAKRDDYTGT